MNKTITILILSIFLGVAIFSLINLASGYTNLTDYYDSINYSCNTYSDCQVKDVHKCCGIDYQCVNENAVTDENFVDEQCEDNNLVSTCEANIPDSCICDDGLCIEVEGSSSECITEGETGSLYQGNKCCSGLIQISNKETPSCVAPDREHFVCAKCGNGECEPGENYCNCARDCKNNSGSDCKNLYWIDNDNKSCSQKEFCGMYMYLGLQTFESKAQCDKAVNESCACTLDARICSDGSAVGRVCPDCEFAPCNKTCPQNSQSENNSCYKTLSNGRKAEIKIMPETASATAIDRLGELNFTVELKEVGKGDDSEVVYELTGKKKGKFLGIFKIMASEKVQIDAETGEVKKVVKPWWAFLASGI